MNNLRFKAYHKKDKCWIDGFSIHSSGLFSDLINAKNVNGLCIADAHWERIADLEHIEIVQYTGLPDIFGVELYEKDIFEELDGSQWMIGYCKELLIWEAIAVNHDASNQHLSEFIDRFNDKVRIYGVRKGSYYD